VFTGLVDHLGRIQQKLDDDGLCRLTVQHDFGALTLGESIAIDGMCMTVTAATSDTFCCDLSPESLRCTVAGGNCIGQEVNLERALRVGDRLGGHFVSGHVDTTAKIQVIESLADCQCWQIAEVPAQWQQYLAVKGSITVNGVSLTLNALQDDGFELMLIPKTLAATTLSGLQVGDFVNLEFDQLAKLVARQVAVMGMSEVNHEL
jgi:riboflavin synthase